MLLLIDLVGPNYRILSGLSITDEFHIGDAGAGRYERGASRWRGMR